MASIFDGLTVSSPALGIGNETDPGPAAQTVPPVTPGSTGRVSPPQQQPPAMFSLPAIGATAPVVVQSATGLMAKVEPEEFVKLVADAGSTLVLYTPQKTGGAQRGAADRYVASIGGVIFVTLTDRTLSLPPGTRMAICMAVLSDGRPLGHQDNM